MNNWGLNNSNARYFDYFSLDRNRSVLVMEWDENKDGENKSMVLWDYRSNTPGETNGETITSFVKRKTIDTVVNNSINTIRYNFTNTTFLPSKIEWNVKVVQKDVGSTSTFASENRTLNVYAGCVCPGTGKNWEMRMDANCVINSDCNIGTGNISFVNTGNITFNATIQAANIEPPSSGQTIWVGEAMRLLLGL